MKQIVQSEIELFSYLLNELQLPRKKIKKLLTEGSIFVNNKKITQYNFKLYPSMEVTISPKKDKLLDIIYEDDYIIVVNKPASLLTIATTKEKEKTLYHYVSTYLKKKHKNSKVFIVHRLDRDTSGVVLFAKDYNVKKIFQDNWSKLVKIRAYQAIIEGHLPKNEGTLINYLCESKTNMVYVSNNKNGKQAITNYKVIKENKKYSLVDINIETGRKNQIRVQFSYINHQIVGDKKYGKITSTDTRLYLHATKLVIFHPILKKELILNSPLPNEFSKLI